MRSTTQTLALTFGRRYALDMRSNGSWFLSKTSHSRYWDILNICKILVNFIAISHHEWSTCRQNHIEICWTTEISQVDIFAFLLETSIFCIVKGYVRTLDVSECDKAECTRFCLVLDLVCHNNCNYMLTSSPAAGEHTSMLFELLLRCIFFASVIKMVVRLQVRLKKFVLGCKSKSRNNLVRIHNVHCVQGIKS